MYEPPICWSALQSALTMLKVIVQVAPAANVPVQVFVLVVPAVVPEPVIAVAVLFGFLNTVVNPVDWTVNSASAELTVKLADD